MNIYRLLKARTLQSELAIVGVWFDFYLCTDLVVSLSDKIHYCNKTDKNYWRSFVSDKTYLHMSAFL